METLGQTVWQKVIRKPDIITWNSCFWDEITKGNVLRLDGVYEMFLLQVQKVCENHLADFLYSLSIVMIWYQIIHSFENHQIVLTTAIFHNHFPFLSSQK